MATSDREDAPLIPKDDKVDQKLSKFHTDVHLHVPDMLPEDFEETAYAATLAITVKDLNRISRKSAKTGISVARLMVSMLLLWLLILIQVYLLVQIKIFVTSPAVRSIRQVYDSFERHMYKGYVKQSGYGFTLGIGGPKGPYYDVTAFETFNDKGTVCQIPFSQWKYLGIVLLIWTLTIIGEIKSALNQLLWLWNLETVPLDEAVSKRDEEFGEHEEPVFIIEGLPIYLKVIIILTLVLPRIIIAVLLCWLGCRWLSATLEFQEVLINGVALEFIINLNSLLYDKLMSTKNKRDVINIKKHLPTGPFDKPTIYGYLGTFCWALIAVLWVGMYLFKLQMVIPGYNWDVAPACAAWTAERYNFWRI